MENSTVTQNLTGGDEIQYLVWYYLPSVLTVPPLGLPANALVVRLLLGKPGICSTSEIFILTLALLDTLFCLLFLGEYLRFLSAQTMEAANFTALGLNQAGGPVLFCLLAVDSYMAVCQPLVFLRLKDPKLRPGLCAAACVLAVGACGLTKDSPKTKWSVLSAVLCSVVVTMTTCNVLVLKSLGQSGPGGNKKVHPVKKRAFKTVLTALVLVNVHYLPPAGEYLLKQLLPGHFSPFSSLTIVSCFALSTTSLVRPLHYLARTNQLPRVGRDHRAQAAEAV